MSLPSHYTETFKAYDIRWLYTKQIDAPFAYLLGITTATLLEGGTLLIWADSRRENNTIISAFLQWLESQWWQYDIAAFIPPNHPADKTHTFWVCSSSALFFLWNNDYDLSVCISASHNPAWYVWCKFFNKNTIFLSTEVLKEAFTTTYKTHDTSWLDINKQYTSFKVPTHLKQKKKKYLTLLQEQFAQLSQSFSFCIDYSHGAWVTVEQEFLSSLSQQDHTQETKTAEKARHDITHLNNYADGSFPSHESDTQDSYCYKDVVKNIKEENHDFGCMFDGDADRIWFVDENGTIIRGDLTYALIINELALDKNISAEKKKDIVYDIMSTQTLETIAQNNNMSAHCVRTGRFFVQEATLKHNALIWWESSSHFLYNMAPRWAYEVPLLSLYYVMCAIQRHGSLSQAVASVTLSYKWPLQKIHTDNRDSFLSSLKALFPDMQDTAIDGVNLVWKNTVIIGRKSNTEPIIRIWIEAETQQEHDSIKEKIRELSKNTSL